MPKAKPKKRPIESYEHKGEKRLNNPPVGLVTPKTDPDAGKKKHYAYDPHLDPQLQWAGKAEHCSFEVPTVSLHVHERIASRTILEAVKRRNGNGEKAQLSMFEESRQEPLREAVEFYQHAHGWSNRLIAGDSLLVMNSLLEKEGMAGKVQCVYMDPPYGIKYGSNFQPFINKRDVKDGKDEDLSSEPETIKAFRDTWELGIHSYLSYMRDRLLLARELLTESGSVFVQISDENVHHIREIMDEVFGVGNFINQITYRTTSGLPEKFLSVGNDFILWYAKDRNIAKYREMFKQREHASHYNLVEIDTGEIIRLNNATSTQIERGKLLTSQGLMSAGFTKSCTYDFKYQDKIFPPQRGKSWKTHQKGMEQLAKSKRLLLEGNTIRYKRYADDFPLIKYDTIWDDTWSEQHKKYVVQTGEKIIQRCILMTTDPGDLVFDPTCGSGTTAYVAEQWGRRWITCDTSRVALALARQRLMTTVYDYYRLAHPDEGVGSGFEYKKVPHITLKSIANNEPPATEILYDQPLVNNKKKRVSGPFTVEAVPSPVVKSIGDMIDPPPQPGDLSVTRSGETLRQEEWRDELLRTGIRGKAGQHIRFARLEPWPSHWLHAEGETKPDNSGADNLKEAATAYQPRRAVISFGPEHAPLEQRQVELALQEASKLKPQPSIIVFVAFQFDPEASKDIDETDWPDVTLLKVQMNADIQNKDLKKKQASNESFWLVGQPDVGLRQIRKGDYTGKWQVEVRGFDYFNTKTGELESGSEERIAIWMLDTNYDGRSLYPSQVFLPMANEKEGWTKLAKNLKTEIDDDMIEAYRGTVSLPFEMGDKEQVAVKIVDDRGVESLRILPLYKGKN